VFNDAALTLIKLKQGDGQGGPGAVGYAGVDFATVAAGLGVPGRAVSDVAQLRAALTTSGSGPLLVDARIDPSGYPHVLNVTRG
jgi:acetolactate synthase I/II/III large subunit